MLMSGSPVRVQRRERVVGSVRPTGSALRRVSPPATLLCTCTPARFLDYYDLG